MNILPKKRWHVRNKDNIARVRKDEAAAREEELKKQEKLKLAESEARVNFLRKRSGVTEKQCLESAEEKTLNEEACSSHHINLFSDYKNHVKTTNKELEKEKKEEQEKYEKKIGYLTYLGQDTNEALRLKSWYEVAPKRLDVGSQRGEINEKDQKIKHNHDPLTLINALLPTEAKSIFKSTSLNRKRERSRTPPLTNKKGNRVKSPKKHKKERGKHKKDKHKKRSKEYKHKKGKSKEKNVLEEQIQKRLKLEQLRKERLYRETTERARQEALLAPKEPLKPTEATIGTTPKIVQKYNSQFNPELAKQNMN